MTSENTAPAVMLGVEEIQFVLAQPLKDDDWIVEKARAILDLFAPVLAEKERRGRREVWEVANQLGGYIGPDTPDDLVAFLSRESDAAADLAQRVLDTEARALAAEAALAGLRQSILDAEIQSDDDEKAQARLDRLAAAIRAEGG
jgi:hypothetical protein